MQLSLSNARIHAGNFATGSKAQLSNQPVYQELQKRCAVRVHASNHDSSTSARAEHTRAMVASTVQYSVRNKNKKTPEGGLPLFIHKVKLAWHIFFPEEPKAVSPKEEVKKRLRMVLVADRCGMSPASLAEMKKTICKALEDYVDIEGEDGIEVAISNEPGLGTVYSVNIPVRRVKSDVRNSPLVEGSPDGITLEWSPDNWDADPSARFPMGC